MAVYKVDRTLGKLSDEEFDAAALRAITCLAAYPEITWLRSFYDEEKGQLTCVYQTEQPEKIPEHAAAAHIPCDAVHLVREFTPADLA
jgi:hypothetical protein